MGAFTKKILQQLETCEDMQDDTDCVQIAGDLLSRHTVRNFQSHFYPEVDREKVSAQEAQALKTALLNLYQRQPKNFARGTVLWALGKSHDVTLKDFFVQETHTLAEAVTEANGTLFQVLIALEGIGEPVFEETRSIDEIAINLEQARKYLAQYGIVIPW